MLRLTARLDSSAASLPPETPRLRLTFQERARSRLAAVLPGGEAVAIVLARGTVMRDGAVLAGEGGERLIIEAAPEPLARITAPTAHALLRAVYHLANRHVPAQLGVDHAIVERDAVLERMLIGLGAAIEHIEAPFEPESGAYDGQGSSHQHVHRDEADAQSATIGEQLSIAAHRGNGS